MPFLLVSAVLLLAVGSANAEATVYYVKPVELGGNDNLCGTSDSQAWASINRVNQGPRGAAPPCPTNPLKYEAGDVILFKSNNTYTGQLTANSNFFNPSPSATPSTEIRIGSYSGSGVEDGSKATMQRPGGTGTKAIHILNLGGFHVTNLKLVGNVAPNVASCGTTNGNGIGLYVDGTTANQASPFKYVHIDNVEVLGFCYGIHFNTAGSTPSTSSYYRDVSIDNINVHDNGVVGLTTDSSLGVFIVGGNAWEAGASPFSQYTQLEIKNSTFTNNAGYGAYVYRCDATVPAGQGYCRVANNVFDSNGGEFATEAGAANVSPVALQLDATGGVVEFNTVANQRDGGATVYDDAALDIVGIDNIIQYNFTHDNAGAGLYSDGHTAAEGLLRENCGNIWRFNISANDALAKHGALFMLGVHNGTAPGCTRPYNDVYHNTIVTFGSAPAVKMTGPYAFPDHIRFFNNVFYVANGQYVYDDTGVGALTNIVFRNNDYRRTGTGTDIVWAATSYTLNGWSNLSPGATGNVYERVSGSPTYETANPGFCSATGTTDAASYKLASGTGGVVGLGLNLPSSEYGLDVGNRDYFGNTPIPQGTAFDIGANEWQSGQTCSGGNLLSNPGFESGSPAPWLGWGTAGVASNYPHSGTYQGFVVPSVASSGLYQQVTAPASGSYTFQAYVAEGNLSGAVGIGITVDGVTVNFAWVTGATYAPYTVTAPTVSAGQAIGVFLWADVSATGWAVIDTTSLTRSQ